MNKAYEAKLKQLGASYGYQLKAGQGDNLSSVIPRETRNLRPANNRFLVSLGMTSSEVSRLKWVAQVIAGAIEARAQASTFELILANDDKTEI